MTGPATTRTTDGEETKISNFREGRNARDFIAAVISRDIIQIENKGEWMPPQNFVLLSTTAATIRLSLSAFGIASHVLV